MWLGIRQVAVKRRSRDDMVAAGFFRREEKHMDMGSALGTIEHKRLHVQDHSFSWLDSDFPH